MSGRFRIRSEEASHFRGALAQNAMELEDLGTAPGTEMVIDRVTVWSDENLAWDVSFWRNNDSQPNADLDLNAFVDLVTFEDTDGQQIAGSGPFIYSLSFEGFGGIPYIPDASNFVVGLICRSSGGKTAGDGGSAVVEVAGRVV